MGISQQVCREPQGAKSGKNPVPHENLADIYRDERATAGVVLLKPGCFVLL